jgi:hypothetical protein
MVAKTRSKAQNNSVLGAHKTNLKHRVTFSKNLERIKKTLHPNNARAEQAMIQALINRNAQPLRQEVRNNGFGPLLNAHGLTRGRFY